MSLGCAPSSASQIVWASGVMIPPTVASAMLTGDANVSTPLCRPALSDTPVTRYWLPLIVASFGLEADVGSPFGPPAKASASDTARVVTGATGVLLVIVAVDAAEPRMSRAELEYLLASLTIV